MDSAVGSGSLTEIASLNVEARSLDTFSALVSVAASHFITIKPFRAETWTRSRVRITSRAKTFFSLLNKLLGWGHTVPRSHLPLLNANIWVCVKCFWFVTLERPISICFVGNAATDCARRPAGRAGEHAEAARAAEEDGGAAGAAQGAAGPAEGAHGHAGERGAGAGGDWRHRWVCGSIPCDVCYPEKVELTVSQVAKKWPLAWFVHVG